MRPLPTIHDYVVKETIDLSHAPYHCLNATLSRLGTIDTEDQRFGIEDLLSMKKDLAGELVAMIVSNLGVVDRVYQVNVESIESDMMRVGDMIRMLPPDKKYYWGRERVALEKEKLALKKEVRDQRSARSQQSAMLLKELREAALTMMKEKKKGRLLDLEGGAGEDERGKG